MTSAPEKVDYGIDAPNVLRNFFLIGAALMLAGLLLPAVIRLGPILLQLRPTLLWPGGFCLAEGCLYLLYVKHGKFLHRDFMLDLHSWSGAEQVLDVGCGRGLLLIGAAKHLTSGQAVGIDIWSTEDLSGNAESAVLRNIALEGVADRASVQSMAAQSMNFPDGSFDLVVSNLCLHNIYDRKQRSEALAQIARVLRPGGTALLSDYKLTGEYADFFRSEGWRVERRWGSLATTFPPLRVVIARKPA